MESATAEEGSIDTWVFKQGAWLEVLLRRALYTMGVFVVMVLEKTFEGRHDAPVAVLSQVPAALK